jgi:hypothetical protein
MAQGVSQRPLTTEARVRSRVSPRGIFGGQSGNGTGFPPPPEYFGFPRPFSFHRCSIKMEKQKNLIIFLTGLHNKPQGCGASVVSAAGPFTTKKNRLSLLNSERVSLCIRWREVRGQLHTPTVHPPNTAPQEPTD